MADILIRGMEMPKNGHVVIRIYSHGRVENETTEREIGTAAPIRAGHGRLIDADALAEDLDFDVENDQRALDDLNIVGIERERIQFDKDCKQNCMWYLTKCQTIVPAEGGAENG